MIYFNFPETTAVVYFDDFLILGEGLRELGVDFGANANWWRDEVDGPFLFEKQSKPEPDNGTVEVFSYRSLRYFDEYDRPIEIAEFPHETKVHPNSTRILIDLDDGYKTPAFDLGPQKIDMVLRGKYNRRAYQPENFVPWAYGISSRVLRSLKSCFIPFRERRDVALMNFGASHSFSHGTRSLFTPEFSTAIEKFMRIDNQKDNLTCPPNGDYERLMWRQTQRRHCAAYYDRLAEAKIIAAFCGEMIAPAPWFPNYLVGGRRASIRRSAFHLLSYFDPRPMRSIQWDSWRFWEGLAAGCLVFNIDLDYYGVQLPVMPVNGEHYVGLRHDRIEQGVIEILSDPNRMEHIASSGREWALEHYSPLGLAKQFLSIVKMDV